MPWIVLCIQRICVKAKCAFFWGKKRQKKKNKKKRGFVSINAHVLALNFIISNSLETCMPFVWHVHILCKFQQSGESLLSLKVLKGTNKTINFNFITSDGS